MLFCNYPSSSQPYITQSAAYFFYQSPPYFMTFIMQKLIQPYLKISKFKVILLMLITAWMGVLLAPKPAGWSEMQTITALIGIMLIAASGSAMNHLAEIEVDQKMARTQKRPLATGELSSKQVIIFATLCLLIGSIVLHFLITLKPPYYQF